MSARSLPDVYIGGEPYDGPCETCDGEGVVEDRHPMWGSLSCPEAWITVPCPDCRESA